MTHNVGRIDRIVRFVVAIILAILYLTKIVEGEAATWVLSGSALLFMTSMRRCCPFYALLGFGTCGVDTGTQKARIKVKKIDLKDL